MSGRRAGEGGGSAGGSTGGRKGAGSDGRPGDDGSGAGGGGPGNQPSASRMGARPVVAGVDQGGGAGSAGVDGGGVGRRGADATAASTAQMASTSLRERVLCSALAVLPAVTRMAALGEIKRDVDAAKSPGHLEGLLRTRAKAGKLEDEIARRANALVAVEQAGWAGSDGD